MASYRLPPLSRSGSPCRREEAALLPPCLFYPCSLLGALKVLSKAHKTERWRCQPAPLTCASLLDSDFLSRFSESKSAFLYVGSLCGASFCAQAGSFLAFLAFSSSCLPRFSPSLWSGISSSVYVRMWLLLRHNPKLIRASRNVSRGISSLGLSVCRPIPAAPTCGSWCSHPNSSRHSSHFGWNPGCSAISHLSFCHLHWLPSLCHTELKRWALRWASGLTPSWG